MANTRSSASMFYPHFFTAMCRSQTRLLSLITLNRVIDGADSTLDAIERTPVNEKNRPTQEIILEKVGLRIAPASSGT